jgi:hypothetical protein
VPIKYRDRSGNTWAGAAQGHDGWSLQSRKESGWKILLLKKDRRRSQGIPDKSKAQGKTLIEE